MTYLNWGQFGAQNMLLLITMFNNRQTHRSLSNSKYCLMIKPMFICNSWVFYKQDSSCSSKAGHVPGTHEAPSPDLGTTKPQKTCLTSAVTNTETRHPLSNPFHTTQIYGTPVFKFHTKKLRANNKDCILGPQGALGLVLETDAFIQ